MSNNRRVGRGEALKRFFLEEKQGVPTVNSEVLGPRASQLSTEIANGNLHVNGGKNGYANGGKNGFAYESTKKNGNVHSLAGAGRAKLFHNSSSSGSSSKSPKDIGASDSEVSPKTLDEQLSSLGIDCSSSEREDSPLICMGSSGNRIGLSTNYFRLDTEPNRGIYMYFVSFSPDVDSLIIRKKLMNQLSKELKETRLFDGATLYLPYELERKETTFNAQLHDGREVEIKLMLVKKMKMGDKEAVHLFNVLFRRIMNILSLVLHGGKFTDPISAQIIPEHKLEIWPGFVTAVEQYEDGVMLQCDVSFRVLQKLTVYELMSDLISVTEGDKWKEILTDTMMNQTVLTRYNNKSYRIDEIVFDGTPMDTFTRKDEKITYVDYYKQHYDINIVHKQQPLLRGVQRAKVKGQELIQCVDLIPELCYLSGITDTMRNDHKIMKSIIQYSRVSPKDRQRKLEQLLKRIHSNDEASQLLSNWGLKLASRCIKLEGRLLDPEPIIFGDGVVHSNEDNQCDWSRTATTNPLLSSVDLHSWVVLCTARDANVAEDFVRMCFQVSKRLNMRIAKPRIIKLPSDATQNYAQELRRLKNTEVQLVFIMFPLARNDKYSAVKKLCCIENPIPSQVAITRTLRNENKLRSIAQKIVLQMNCKLGGTLWQVKMPIKNTMVVGLDSYHDPSRKGQSVGAVVASANDSITRWYSTVFLQSPGTELINGLETAITRCLLNYNKVKGYYPDQIVVFRDGLGDGQMETCSRLELPQLLRACTKIYDNYNPKILFVVVQKRINTKLFFEDRGSSMNPPPGTILDHTVTRRNQFDFFLVSQNVRQGTVTPTHYVVLHNSTSMDPDKIQRLSYKMTHLYYNWCGTIRTPAPCQYAHKLAGLVGQHLHNEADESLNDKLFFL